MNIIKIAIGVSCSIMLLLCMLTISTESSEDTFYKKTVETLITEQGFSSHTELIEAFPELRNIEADRKRIHYLKESIEYLIGGPNPNTSEQVRLQIKNHKDEINQLKENINQQLNQIRAAYAAN